MNAARTAAHRARRASAVDAARPGADVSDEYPTLTFASPAEWHDWLAAHHDDSDGVWLRFAKKGTGIASLDHAGALDVALCFGWIDGQGRAVDETWWQVKFTPRRARSLWSKRNREKAERLIAEGRMHPAGMREVERAKADGRWDAAYDAASTAVVPAELQRELDADPEAAKAFAALDARNRYSMIHRIQTAKKPETRARRAAQFAEMLRAGEKPIP